QSRTLPPMSSIKIGSGERSNKVRNSGSRSVTRMGGILATKRHKIHTRFLEPQRHKDTEKRRDGNFAAFLCVFVSLWFIRRREGAGDLYFRRFSMCNSQSSRLRGQSCFRRRERPRSASNRPSVWHVAQ